MSATKITFVQYHSNMKRDVECWMLTLHRHDGWRRKIMYVIAGKWNERCKSVIVPRNWGREPFYTYPRLKKGETVNSCFSIAQCSLFIYVMHTSEYIAVYSSFPSSCYQTATLLTSRLCINVSWPIQRLCIITQHFTHLLRHQVLQQDFLCNYTLAFLVDGDLRGFKARWWAWGRREMMGGE